MITLPELQEIRRIWVVDKHEFEDSLPRIYLETTKREYPGVPLHEHSAFGAAEAKLLQDACGDDPIHFEMMRELIDTEQRHRNMARRAGLFDKLESAIRRSFYESAEDAKQRALRRKSAKDNPISVHARDEPHQQGLSLKPQAEESSRPTDA